MDRGRLGRLTLVLLTVTVTIFALAMLVKAFVSDDAEVGRLAGYASILAVVLAVPAVWQLVTSRPAAAEELDLLAGGVFKQWSTEARRLGLDDRLDIGWTAEHDTPGQTFAEAFRGLPHPRLVLLGSPGAGKTVAAVRLLLELAREPRDGPVPVLVGLAGWNPEAEDLDPWLAVRLAETYPFLSRTSARDLVERGRIMPILDGLDEVAPQLRARAMERISGTAVGGRPLVLTCRRNEYDALIGSHALLVADASVWCLDRVGPGELERYLNQRRPRGDQHWRAVLDRVAAEPDGPLATALSTPLMASMARAVYSSADPDALLRFPDRDGIERHLLVCGTAAMFLGTDLGQRPPATASDATLKVGLAFGVAAWIGYALTSTAWGWFCLIRVRLALTGALPWRLMAFLADAHRRKVLRQSGPVYEFRHSRLQDFLRG